MAHENLKAAYEEDAKRTTELTVISAALLQRLYVLATYIRTHTNKLTTAWLSILVRTSPLTATSVHW